MEQREDTEPMSVTEAEADAVQQEAADDNEGFQPVTNKKNEKLKEKETQREKEAKKKNKRGKSSVIEMFLHPRNVFLQTFFSLRFY